MQLEQFKLLYEKNHIDQKKYEEAILILNNYQERLNQISIDDASIEQLDQFISSLKQNHACTIDVMIVLMRYYRMIKRNDLFIHLTKYTGGLGVIESIIDRLKHIVGKEKHREITQKIKIPELGTHPNEFPKFTEGFVKLLENTLDQKTVKCVLAGNHHQIPSSAFLDEKTHYENSDSLDQYLKELHQRKIEILGNHFKNGTVWFEQEISQEVLDFVKSNQEILSAVRKDDYLYVTKIPYDTKAYLSASTNEQKRYHACHCPFAKESIKSTQTNISGVWCNCSAGFGKYPFEIILDQELEIEVLENVLRGDMQCRFRIPLIGIKYKK